MCPHVQSTMKPIVRLHISPLSLRGTSWCHQELRPCQIDHCSGCSLLFWIHLPPLREYRHLLHIHNMLMEGMYACMQACLYNQQHKSHGLLIDCSGPGANARCTVWHYWGKPERAPHLWWVCFRCLYVYIHTYIYICIYVPYIMPYSSMCSFTMCWLATQLLQLHTL